LRFEGYTWWPDEELSNEELLKIQEKYLDLKPKIMVTHDCPDIIADEIMSAFNTIKYEDPSRTRQAFNSYWELHKPDIWIFGHWHTSMDFNRLGTRFICLNELEVLDL
jgi:hypothetical protein